jgi:serpin B
MRCSPAPGPSGLTAVSRAARAASRAAAGLGLAAVGALASTAAFGAPAPGTTTANVFVAAAAAAAPVPASRALASGVPAAAATAAAAALGELGLALLREPQTGANAVVSPLALANALGMVHAGARGPAGREVEALFGAGRQGARILRRALPAVNAQLRSAAPGGKAPALNQAARVWMGSAVAKDVSAPFKRRLSRRWGADATTVDFSKADTARGQINRWTAERTAGRIPELLPTGALGKDTQLALTTAVHFRSPWAQPFDGSATEPRPFTTSAGTALSVPSLVDERSVAQAQVDGVQVYALPFSSGFDLIVAMPAAGSEVATLARSGNGAALQRWRAALQPAKCSFSMPKFNFAAKPGSMKSALERLGVKTLFSTRADLQPMLGRSAGNAHVDDVHHAAGMAVDEQGGEAVAAMAISIKPKSLAAAVPTCAVDRAFVFAVVHQTTGTPVFMGRVGDPSKLE